MLQTAISSFNAMGKPLRAALTVTRAPVAAVGLAWLLSELFGVVGVFAAVALADAMLGVVACAMLLPWLRRGSDVDETAADALPTPA